MSLPIGIFKQSSSQPIAWIGGSLDEFEIVTELKSATHFTRATHAWLNKAKLTVSNDPKYAGHDVAWDTS